jgi:RNA polymerase sigma-70 factor (ECF subfamily)
VNQQDAASLLASYFDSWYSALVRYAFRATGDLNLAEDLVQEVYLRLYHEMRRGKEIEKPEAWMFCVLSHDLGKFWRLQKKTDALHQPLGDTDLADVAQPEAEAPAFYPDSDDIAELLSVLTAREQEVMLLRMASLKYREIGEKLGISGSAVNTLLARAIRKLHKAAKKKNWEISGEVGKHISTTLQ